MMMRMMMRIRMMVDMLGPHFGIHRLKIFITLLQATMTVVTTMTLFGLLHWLWKSLEQYVVIPLRVFIPYQVMMMLDDCGPLPLSHYLQIFFTLVLATMLEVLTTKAIRMLLCLCKTLAQCGKNAVQILRTSLIHALIVCFHSIRCLPILRGFIYFRVCHSLRGLSRRLLMFSKMQSIVTVRLIIVYLTLSNLVDAAALSGCAPACYGDPDHYCTSFFGSSVCRECELTCGNENHWEECLRHCKGSQFFPRVLTTSEEVATTSSSSPSSAVSVGGQLELTSITPSESISTGVDALSTVTAKGNAEVPPVLLKSEVPPVLLASMVTFLVLFGLFFFVVLLWYCGVDCKKVLCVFCLQDTKCQMSSSPQDADVTTDIPLLNTPGQAEGQQQQADIPLLNTPGQAEGQQQQADRPYQTASTRESVAVHPSDDQSDCSTEEGEAQMGEPSRRIERKGTSKPDVRNQPLSPCDDGDVNKTRLALSNDSSRPPKDLAIDDIV